MKFPPGKRCVVEKVKLQGKMMLLFCYLTGYCSEGWWDVLLAHKEKAELGALLPLRLGEEELFPTSFRRQKLRASQAVTEAEVHVARLWKRSSPASSSGQAALPSRRDSLPS